MAPKQEDRGVEPESDDIVLTGEEENQAPRHVRDALGRPAEPEDDLASD